MFETDPAAYNKNPLSQLRDAKLMWRKNPCVYGISKFFLTFF